MNHKTKVVVTRQQPEDFEEWERFITNSSNGTIFHSLRFLAYHPPDKFRHHHLMFRLRGKLRAVFTGAEVACPQGLELHSHPGASYGGIVIRKRTDFEDYYGVVEALTDYAQAAGFSAVNLTQTPLIYYQSPAQGVEYALAAYGFKHLFDNLTQSVDLTAIGDDASTFIIDKTRNAYRQALRNGLTYDEGVELTKDNLTDFHRMLMENRRGLGVIPAHTLDDLWKLAEIMPKNLHLTFVERGDSRIAGLLHFICNPRVALLFYVCHYRETQHLKPVPFLLANTLNWARRRGFRELDFGISTVDGTPTWGLLKFKENFRARPFLRTTFRKQL